MKNAHRSRRTPCILALLCFFLFSARSFSQSVAVFYTASGDGGTNGGSVTTAVATVGGKNLTATSVSWSSNVPASAQTPLGAAAFSYSFSGSSGESTVPTSYLLSTTLATTAIHNWAIEAWVNVSTNNTAALFFQNGTANDGYGLGLQNGFFTGLLGGIRWVTSSISPTIGQWTHLAFVNDNDNLSLFINGTVAATSTGAANVPGANATGASIASITIGGGPASLGAQGLVADAKIFTFTGGTFSTSMLNYSAVPEPSTWGLLGGLASLALARWHRRRTGKEMKRCG